MKQKIIITLCVVAMLCIFNSLPGTGNKYKYK